MCVNACMNMSRAGEAGREEFIGSVETGIRSLLSRKLLENVDQSAKPCKGLQISVWFVSGVA